MIRIEELDQRVTLLEPTVTASAAHEPVTTFSAAATVWARVKGLRGAEKLQAQQTYGTAMREVLIRYYRGVDQTWRLRHGSAEYDIREIVEVGRREGLLLTCLERQPGATP